LKLHEITIIEEASRCLLCYDAPCSKACPAGSDPASFVKAIRLNNRRGGARQAIENNLLGVVCAAACTASKYCERACIRGKIDRPVPISSLHVYIAQIALECGFTPTQHKEKANLKAVILGGGMAGLTAAAELAKSGAQVTVYTEGPVWGAELAAKLDDGKLGSSALNDGLQKLRELGIKMRLAEEIDDMTLERALLEYDTVVVASKKFMTDFGVGNPVGIILTGELVPGPNDAAYSVKKGKEAASHALEFAFAKEESG
jgi:dihydropyrimidine dehydrogenase (NAD+) subunit PreT